MIKRVKNEEGVALMMVLVISAVVLAVTTSMLYMLTTGTQISGLKKRHATAVEAAMGCESTALDFIGGRGTPSLNNSVSITVTASDTCKDDKIMKSTEDWDSSCDHSFIINSTDSASYDLEADLGNYMCYAKIVDTVEGNSGNDTMDMLISKGVVDDDWSSHMVQISYIYSLEVESVNKSRPTEKSRLSLVYVY